MRFIARFFIALLAVLLMGTQGAASAPPLLQPDMRGFHCVIPPRNERAKMLLLVDELARMGINTLVLQVDYRFQFRNIPEMKDDMWYTLEDARELARHCAERHVTIIPQMSCVGHQSYGGGAPTLKFLQLYPQFDETPGVPSTTEGMYCREWCVSNPDVYPVVFSLIDDIADAFNAKDFHVGMDEIFLMGDGKCDRCRGKDRSELLATAVNKLHHHIVDEQHMRMYMWADRLIDGKATKYGKWEGSENDTFRAIDMIPTDIVLCDWHYEVRDEYPSVDSFLAKGFTVWPAVWRNEEATRKFIQYAVSHNPTTNKRPYVAGVLFTTWVYPEIFGILYGEDADGMHPYYAQAIRNVQMGMRQLNVPTIPFPPEFHAAAFGYVDTPTSVTITAEPGSTIRYTTDGSDVSEKSPVYTTALIVAEPTTLYSRAFNEQGASLITKAEVKKVDWMHAVPTPKLTPGLMAYTFEGAFQSVKDFPSTHGALKTVSTFDSSIAERRNKIGIRFDGFIKVESDGIYTFDLATDDGGVLWIDDQMIVDNDGVHVARWREGMAALQKGYHTVRLSYFNKAEDGEIQVEWRGPRVERQRIPASVLFSASTPE